MEKSAECVAANGPTGFIQRMSGFLKRKSQVEQERQESTASSQQAARWERDSVFSAVQYDTAPLIAHHTPPAHCVVQLDQQSTAHGSPPSPPPPSTAPNAGNQLHTMSPKKIEEAFDHMMQEYAWPASTRNALKTLPTENKMTLLYQHQHQLSTLLKKTTTSSLSDSFWSTLGLKRSGRPDAQRTFATPEPTPHAHKVLDGGHSFRSNSAGAEGTSSADPLLPSAKSGFGIPGRRRSLRTGSHGEKTKSSPEYFVHLLRETPVRELEESDLSHLRIYLRNLMASWTTKFLLLGGYEALTGQLKQMCDLRKRIPQDSKTVLHLIKCVKAIMTHDLGGSEKVLTHQEALVHIRHLLFMPTNAKRKAIYGFDMETRFQLLDVFRLLTTIEIKGQVHGYDVMRTLLLDRDEDEPIEEWGRETDYPFPMSLKPDVKSIMHVILEEEEPGSAAHRSLCPRYKSWMNEFLCTVEQHIERVRFYATALADLDEDEIAERGMSTLNNIITVEEGVVDYLILHLKIINVIVNHPATAYVGRYGPYEQEKTRIELMMAGLNHASEMLWRCPHPLLHKSYIDYLRPLVTRRATFQVPSISFPISPAVSPAQDSARTQPNRHTVKDANKDADLLRWEDYVNSNSLMQETAPRSDHDDDDDLWEDIDPDDGRYDALRSYQNGQKQKCE